MKYLRSKIKFFVIIFIIALCCSNKGIAQFRNPISAGTMRSSTQSDTTEYSNDTTTFKPNFTLKKYFRSLAHKDTMTISNVFFGAMVLPGTGQWYNKDYWKVPVVYGLLGGTITGAVISNQKWKRDKDLQAKDLRDFLIWGAMATYWGQLMDATVKYKSYDDHLPARASLYSALLPGLGQIYNGDYWHVPIYYAGFMVSGYSWAFNQRQYKRYRNYLKEVVDGTYTGIYSESDLIWFRDSYRRYRDYSVIATILVYILNIIDANVFAHFTKFDISDDLTFNIQPTIVQPVTPVGNYYGYSPTFKYNKFGFQMNIKF